MGTSRNDVYFLLMSTIGISDHNWRKISSYILYCRQPKHRLFQGQEKLLREWRSCWLQVEYIRITFLCNVYHFDPHFYIAKLEYAGVYLLFLFVVLNIDCGYTS